MDFDRVPKPPGLLFRATGARLVAFGPSIHSLPEMIDVFADRVEISSTDGDQITGTTTHAREEVLSNADLAHDIEDTYGPTVLEQILAEYLG